MESNTSEMHTDCGKHEYPLLKVSYHMPLESLVRSLVAIIDGIDKSNKVNYPDTLTTVACNGKVYVCWRKLSTSFLESFRSESTDISKPKYENVLALLLSSSILECCKSKSEHSGNSKYIDRVKEEVQVLFDCGDLQSLREKMLGLADVVRSIDLYGP